MNKLENLPLLTRSKIRIFGKKIWVSIMELDVSILAIFYKGEYYLLTDKETLEEKKKLEKSTSSDGSEFFFYDFDGFL